MIVLTPSGLRFCPSEEMGALPAWLTGIGKAILSFFKAVGPAAIQLAIAQNQKIAVPQNGTGGGTGTQRPPQIVLTPEMARKWLELFCQFGLLPRENCFGTTPAPGPTPQPQPTPTPPPSSGNWWERIPTPVWIALAVLGVAILVRQLR
jgi:hypothetical protein